MVDYFKVLGLNSSASDEEIKTAYRKLSKKFHPDMNDGDKFFEERFKEIQTAYEKLNDPNYRTAFRNFQNKGAYQKSEYQTNSKKAEHNPPPKPPPSPTQPKTKKPFISSGAIITFLVLAGLGIFRAVMNDEIQKNGLKEYREYQNNRGKLLHDSLDKLKSDYPTLVNSPVNSMEELTEPTINSEPTIFEGKILSLNENDENHPSGEMLQAMFVRIENISNECDNCNTNFSLNDGVWIYGNFIYYLDGVKDTIYHLDDKIRFTASYSGGNPTLGFYSFLTIEKIY